MTINRNENTLFLIGAGFSAESGIPTFRGKDGYWKVGSRNYKPEVIGTRRMFQAQPKDVWNWYIYRKEIISQSLPNVAHKKLAEISKELKDNFILVSQNIDGLHTRAGVPEGKTFNIHGDMSYVRCFNDCVKYKMTFPVDYRGCNGDILWDKFKCPHCGGWLRPHVLWFDESYDELNYKFDSVLNALDDADKLIVIGTEGSTSLPSRVIQGALILKKKVTFVNKTNNSLTELIASAGSEVILSEAGQFMRTVRIK